MVSIYVETNISSNINLYDARNQIKPLRARRFENDKNEMAMALVVLFMELIFSLF